MVQKASWLQVTLHSTENRYLSIIITPLHVVSILSEIHNSKQDILNIRMSMKCQLNNSDKAFSAAVTVIS
jgi:hypothetical protein